MIDSPTAMDIQIEIGWVKINFNISVVALCALLSGGGQWLCGFIKKRVPALELPPNESPQSPQWKAPALILLLSLG